MMDLMTILTLSNASIVECQITYLPENVTNVSAAEDSLTSTVGIIMTLHLVQKIVCIFSLIFNILVIIVILGDRKPYTTANLLIVNLAVAQIMSLIVRLHVIPMLLEDSLMSSLSCKLWKGGVNWSQAAASLTICLISLERYRATKSLSRSSNIPQHKLAIGIAVVWICTFAISSEKFIMVDITPICEQDSVGFCYLDKSKYIYYDAYTYIFQFLFYFLPLIVMSVAYACVIRSLRYTSTGTTLQPNQVQRMIATRRRVSRTVFLICAAFCVLWFPYVFLQIVWQIHEVPLGIPPEKIPYVIISTEILIELQGCVNFLTLCCLSQSFRQRLLKYIRHVYNCITKCRCACVDKKEAYIGKDNQRFALQSNNDHRATRNTNVTCDNSSQV